MQKPEVRKWCQERYGADWHACDPLIKKARIEEAKKALAKPYAKKPSVNAGNKAKMLEAKNLKSLKPVYFMRQAHPDDEIDDVYYSIPATIAVTLGIESFIREHKIKSTCQPLTSFWNVWVVFDDLENSITAGGNPNPDYGDLHCYMDFGEWDADKVLMSFCKGGDFEDGFPDQLEEGGWNDGTIWQVYNDQVIVGAEVWSKASDETRAKFLRDSFAKTVFILNACESPI